MSEPPKGAPVDRIEVEIGLIDLTHRTIGTTRLSPTETRLLAYFVARPGEVLDRDRLLHEVWGMPAGAQSRTVFATIERLRRKIERDPRYPRHLVTIGRSGYAWRPHNPVVQAAPIEPEAVYIGYVPASDDVFVGRRDEIAASQALLAGSSGLVTLRGPGGIGKTRLALELARLEQPSRRGGVWFCDVSADACLLDVVQTLSITLDLPIGSAEPARHIERLARVLRARGPTLIVFDNAEAAADALREMLERWPRPWPTILATSLCPLDVEGETVVVVDPLPVVTGEDPSVAAQLFVARAREHRRSYQPTAEALASIEQIVLALDGLPLAIELVARWNRLLDPPEMLDRIKRSALVLRASPEDDRPARHHTLEAAIRWSWEALSTESQALFAACSVFRGSFDANAVEAVFRSEETIPSLDLLDGLVRASLVRSEERSEMRRMVMLAAIREFAAARLRERPALERAMRLAHAAYYARFGQSASLRALAMSSRRRDWDLLRLERGNLEQAIEHGHPDDAALAALAASAVLRLSGPIDRQHEPIERILARPDASELSPRVRIDLTDTLGNALRHSAPDRAIAVLREALVLARTHQHRVEQVLESLGTAMAYHGDPVAAEALLTESIAAFESAGDRLGASEALGELASLHVRCGRFAQAQLEFERALLAQRELGATHAEAVNLANLGVVYVKRDRYALAPEAFERALALHHSLGNHNFDSLLANNTGYAYLMSGRAFEAERAYREAIRLAHEQGNPKDEASAQCNLAWLLLDRGALFEAAHYLDASEPIFEALCLPNWLVESHLARAMFHRLEGDLDRSEQRLDAALDDIAAYSLRAEYSAHERAHRGLLALARGDRASASAALAEASAGVIGFPEHSDAARYTASLRRALGE